MKKITLFLFTLLFAVFVAKSQEVLITGYVDSPCPNADGRTVEIYINGTVDLTGWNLVKQSNGGGFTSNISLTDLGELTNQFAYITNNAATLTAEFGINGTNSSVIESGDINDNGNDAFQLIDANAAVIDRFGEDGVDGSGTGWEHTDSYYYRNNESSANGGTFDAANWTIGALNLLDNEGTCNAADALSTMVPFGSYLSAPVGNTCDAPIEITSLPYMTSDDTANYGDDYNNGDSPCSDFYLNGDDVVYSFTPDQDMVVSVLMSNLSDYYSGIHLLDACIGDSPNCVAFVGNDTTNDRSLGEVSLSGGSTYYIIISTWVSPQSVGYDLSIEQIMCPAPSDIMIENITSSSADVSWTAGLSETEWESKKSHLLRRWLWLAPIGGF